MHIPTAAEVRGPAALHLGADRAPGDWVGGHLRQLCASGILSPACSWKELVHTSNLSFRGCHPGLAPRSPCSETRWAAIEEPLGPLKTGRWELCCPPGPSVGSAGKNARSKVLPRTVDYTISQLLQGVWLSINLYLGTAEPGTGLVSKI